MKIEYEAKFPNIDKDEMREKLKNAGAVLVRPEFMQKRVTFNFPEGHEISGGWLRVRDEGDKITIDEWPFLEPCVEVEGKSEEEVKKVSEKIGFDYGKALFCCVTTLYNIKYGTPEEIINNHTPEIVFEGKNPFI